MLLEGSEGGKGEGESGDRPLGIEDKRGRQTDRQTQRRRKGWEVGRALLEGHLVNVHRRCSKWLQLRM